MLTGSICYSGRVTTKNKQHKYCCNILKLKNREMGVAGGFFIIYLILATSWSPPVDQYEQAGYGHGA